MGTVEGMGWRAEPSGGATLLAPGQRRPLVPVDRAAEEQAVRRSFAGWLAAMRVPALLAIAERWRPDLVVRDEMDFAGAVAAERLGLPHAQVLLPMGADQPLNADRCTALGIAVALDAMTSTATEIAKATDLVMSDPCYRANVGPLRDEAASLPDVGHAASLLEQLACSRSPVTGG